MRKDSKTNLPIIFINRSIATFWIVLFVLILNLLIQYYFNWWPTFVPSLLLFGVLALFLPFVSKFLKKSIDSLLPIVKNIIDKSSDEIVFWYHQEGTAFIYSKWANVAVIFVTIFGVFVTWLHGIPWIGIAGLVFYLFEILFFLCTSIVGWFFLAYLILLLKISKQKIKGKLFVWPKKFFDELSASFLEIFFVGFLLYLVSIWAIWIIPWGESWVLISSYISLLWGLPLAGIVLIYFIVCQIIIHRIIKKSKDRRIKTVDIQLESLYKKWKKKEDQNLIKMINELIGWRKEIKSENDWPINIQSFLVVLGGVLLPLIRTILDLFAQ